MGLEIELQGTARSATLFGANLAEAANRPIDAIYFISALARAGGLDDESGEIQALAEVVKMVVTEREQGIDILHQCMKARRRRGTPASVLATAELHHEYLEGSFLILGELQSLIDDHVIPNCTSPKRKVLTKTIAADLHRCKAHIARPLRGSPLEIDSPIQQERSKAEQLYADAAGDISQCNGDDARVFYAASYSCYLYESGNRSKAISVAEDAMKKVPPSSANAIMLANNLRIWRHKVVFYGKQGNAKTGSFSNPSVNSTTKNSSINSTSGSRSGSSSASSSASVKSRSNSRGGEKFAFRVKLNRKRTTNSSAVEVRQKRRRPHKPDPHSSLSSA